jgi:hypothetical protein
MALVLAGLLGFVLLNQRKILQVGTPAEPVGATEHTGVEA